MKLCYTTIGITIFALLYLPYYYMMLKLCGVNVTINYHHGIYLLTLYILYCACFLQFFGWIYGCNSTFLIFICLTSCGVYFVYPLLALNITKSKQIEYFRKNTILENVFIIESPQIAGFAKLDDPAIGGRRRRRLRR